MSDAFSWNCPYCDRRVTITNENLSKDRHQFNHFNKTGDLALITEVIVCPNPDCREYEVAATLYRTEKINALNAPIYDRIVKPELFHWVLKPKSGAKPFPSYIPKPILDDYKEACLIVSDSPKASATLSRRCLQGMIRDFWGVSKARLIDEIGELRGKIDPTTWDAIDAVRSVGNIGAHMEKDINLIVDVDPDEAKMLIGLIEFLLKDWYIARYERTEQMKKVIALGATKSAAKTGQPSP